MKRGKALERRTPLARKTRIRARRAEPRKSARVRDLEYMLLVKGLPCCAADLEHHTRCRGPVEADHAGRRPMGRKCHDTECIPLCAFHHRARTDFSGPFRDWSKDEMRKFLDLHIGLTQAAVLLAPQEGDLPW